MNTTGGSLRFDSTIDDSQFQASIRNMNNSINQLAGNVNNQSASIENFAKKAASAASAFLSFQAAAGFIEKMIQVRGEFQQLEVAFTTMLRSKDASNKLMAQMVQLAATTPFSLEEVAKSGKQLLAYGFAADTITENLTKLGDIAAGVSAPIGDIAYLYGTLRTQGVAMTKDIREFAGRGIPIIAELAKVLKTTEKGVSELVTAGKVGFPEVEQAFNNMTSSGGMFFNLMKEQSKTLTGQIANLGDAWDVMLNNMGKSQQGLFAGSIQVLTDLVENYENVLSIITVLTAGYGVYRAALIATAAYERVAAATNVGLAISINGESVARINNAASMLEEMRANVSNLAAKKLATMETYVADAALVKSATQRLAVAKAAQASSAMDVLSSSRVAKAKEVQIATEELLAAKERASASGKVALASSSQFLTAKTELEATAKVANSAATVELTAVESIQAANKKVLTAITAAYNAVLLATPAVAAAAVLTALGVAIYALTQTTNAAAVSQKALNEIQSTVAGNLAEQSLAIKDYVKIIKDASSTETERNTALKKLKDLNPSILGALDSQSIATKKGTDAIKEYLKWLDAKLQGEAAYVIKSEAVKRIAERNVKAGIEGNENTGGLDWSTRLGYSLKKFFTGKSRLKATDEASDIVKLLNQQDQAIIDSVDKKYGAALKQRAIDGQGGPELLDTSKIKNKAYYENIVNLNTAELEALDSGAKDFQTRAKPLIDKIRAAKKALLLFDASDKSKQADQEANKEYNALKRKAEMLQKIYEINDKYNNKSLTEDQQKLAEIRSEYKALQHDIDLYNKNPRNKKVNADLKPALEKAIENQRYEVETKKVSVELDKQKDLYEQFEQAKKDMGETAAKERFENEIDTSKTYLQQLQDQYSKLIYKGVTASITGVPLTGAEQDRLNDGAKKLKDAYKSETDNFQQLLIANATYEQQRAAVTARYNAAFEKLQGDANAGRRAVLTKGYQDELKDLQESAVQKSDAYKKAAEEALILTREQVVKNLAALKNIMASGEIPQQAVGEIQSKIDALEFRLKIGINEGNLDALKDRLAKEIAKLKPKDAAGNEIILTKQQKDDVISNITEIQVAVDKAINPLTGKAKSEFAKGIKERFDYLGKSTFEVATGMSKDLGQLSSGFNELSNALGGNNTQAGYLLGTIGELAGAASDAAGAFASFSSGDIIGGITKTIGAVTKILSIGKKVKEMNAAARKEVEDFYSNAIKGEREYQDLLKERELQTIRNNKIALQGIRDELALRKQQIDAYTKEAAEIMGKLQGQEFVESEEYKHGTWFRKAQVNKTYGSLQGKSFAELSQLLAQGKLEGDTKALVERLKELEQKGYDAEKAIADLAKETSELFTGTTSDNLTNTLADMFKNGKTSAKDLADFFKQSMDDAALSIFKNKVLAGAMESFYAEFDKAAQSGDELSADEIARLNGLFTSLTGDALKKFEEFKKITGSDLKGGEGTSSTGNIRSELTEQTGGRLEGLWRGQYDLTKSLLAFAAERNEILKPIATTQLELLNIGRQKLDIAIRNEQNTFRTANNTDDLSRKLDQIISNTKPSVTARGAGI